MKKILIMVCFLFYSNVFAAKVGKQIGFQQFNFPMMQQGKIPNVHYCVIESGIGGQRRFIKATRCLNPQSPDGTFEFVADNPREPLFNQDGTAAILGWLKGGWRLDSTLITEEKVSFLLSR